MGGHPLIHDDPEYLLNYRGITFSGKEEDEIKGFLLIKEEILRN